MIKDIILAGGCFWGLEDLIRKQPGIVYIEVGYTGGKNDNPTYENHPGHAEAVLIKYDTEKTSYKKLLDFFFQIHNPTTLNQQGNDKGTSYRSAIFYGNEAEKREAENFIEIVNKSKRWSKPVVTTLEPFTKFYKAEEYHQDYLIKNPSGYTCHAIYFDSYLRYNKIVSIKKKTMNIILIIIGVILVGWFLYSWLPVRNIEEPKYTIVSEANGYEIREYASYIVAETTVSGTENRDDAVRKGFSIIAGYIFGDNTKKDKIAMTAPVNTEESTSEKIAMTAPVNTEKIAMTMPVNTQEEAGNGAYNISFVMPSKYTFETLPEPNDKRVVLHEVPARKLAVRRFSWTNSESAFKKHEAELLEALRRDGVMTVGAVNVARYNIPWTIPFMLRNEVQIEVKY